MSEKTTADKGAGKPKQPQSEQLQSQRELSPETMLTQRAGSSLELPDQPATRALRQKAVQQMARTQGNQYVQRMILKLERRQSEPGNRTSTAPKVPTGLQRQVIELPEVAITGDPQFYDRAERRNRHWARHPPTPSWPYDDTLRQLWDQGNFDEFADAVRNHQVDVMGIPFEEADGIMGPQTSASLETHSAGASIAEAEAPRPSEVGTEQPTEGEASQPAEAETEHPTEGEASQPAEAESQPPTEGEPASQTAESGSTALTEEQAEVRQVPEWIMEYARGRPWPVHSVLYEEAMASPGGIGIAGVAPTWDGFLGQMGEMDFLRKPIVGHQVFLRKLDEAQRWLRANHPQIAQREYSIHTPGTRSQWRAAERLTASPHLFGMAVDINSGQNPWMNNPGEEEQERNTLYAWIIWRATWLMGRGSPVTPADSHRRAGSRSSQRNSAEPQSTEDIHRHFNEANLATLDYLRLDGNRTEVEAKLHSIGEPPPAIHDEEYIGGYVPSSIPIERLRQGSNAIDDWMEVIHYDRQHWPNQPRGGGPVSGIMNLPLELVVALRDVARLQWGACDLGENQSGDMMHFALDPPRFYAFRGQVRRRLQQIERGLTPQQVAEATRAERARRDEMAARGSQEAEMARPARQDARRERPRPTRRRERGQRAE